MRDAATLSAVLGLTNNFLSALGLLYAIYLGMSFQAGIDRLRALQSAISREAAGLQAMCELSLTLSPTTEGQYLRLHSALSGYIDHVLSRELNNKVTRVPLEDQISFSCVEGLYGTFGVFKELATNGVDDSVDLRTLDALHDEVRDLVRARSDRLQLTNTSLPRVHWLILMLLSVFTVMGVALNEVPEAPVLVSLLSGVLGLVIPLSFLIVSDMSRPFGGAWSVSDEPLRGVRAHVLPRLARRGGSGGSNGQEDQSRFAA